MKYLLALFILYIQVLAIKSQYDPNAEINYQGQAEQPKLVKRSTPCYQDLGWEAATFNLIAFGNVESPSSDSEGRLAVGGNLTISQWTVSGNNWLTTSSCQSISATFAQQSVNSSGYAAFYKYGLVVGGSASFNGGEVFGYSAIGGSVSTVAQTTTFYCAIEKVMPINFANLKARYITQGLALAALPSTASVTVQWSTLSINIQSNELIQVVQITAEQLAACTSVQLVGALSAEATLIINYPNSSFSFFGDLSQLQPTSRILWNAPNLVSFSYNAFYGSILAPLANIKTSTGMSLGTVIVNSASNLRQVNLPLFQGCLSVAPVTATSTGPYTSSQVSPTTSSSHPASSSSSSAIAGNSQTTTTTTRSSSSSTIATTNSLISLTLPPFTATSSTTKSSGSTATATATATTTTSTSSTTRSSGSTATATSTTSTSSTATTSTSSTTKSSGSTATATSTTSTSSTATTATTSTTKSSGPIATATATTTTSSSSTTKSTASTANANTQTTTVSRPSTTSSSSVSDLIPSSPAETTPSSLTSLTNAGTQTTGTQQTTIFSPGVTTTGTVAPSPGLSCIAEPFGKAGCDICVSSQFNFVTSACDIKGRLGAGGNLIVNKYLNVGRNVFVGSGFSCSKIQELGLFKYAVVARGNVSWPNGTVSNGAVSYSTNSTVSLGAPVLSSVAASSCSASNTNTSAIDFESLYSQLNKLSHLVASFYATGEAHLSGTVLYLSPKSGRTFHVFYVSAEDLVHATAIQWVSQPLAYSTVIINVDPDYIPYDTYVGIGALQLSQDLDLTALKPFSKSLLWNFQGILRVETFVDFTIFGTLLAPNATWYSFGNSLFHNGQFFVSEFQGTSYLFAEFSCEANFQGCIYSSDPNPSPIISDDIYTSSQTVSSVGYATPTQATVVVQNSKSSAVSGMLGAVQLFLLSLVPLGTIIANAFL